MNFKFTESVVEEACLQYFGQLGYTYLPAPEIAVGGLFAERSDDYSETILKQRLHTALTRINRKVPAVAIDDAIRQVTRTDSPTLIVNNRAFHRMPVPSEQRKVSPPIGNARTGAWESACIGAECTGGGRGTLRSLSM